MLNREESTAIVSLLRQEVVPAIGCTEPMAVALAVAKATELLGIKPEKIIAKLSGNIIKNAMGVGIPGSGGMVGLPAAMALGAIAGKSIYNLEVLRDVTNEDVGQARAFIKQNRIIVEEEKKVLERLYIDILVSAKGKTAEVIIAKDHTHFVFEAQDEMVLLDLRGELRQTVESDLVTDLTMQKVYEFSTTVPIEDIRFILDSATMNKSAAEEAFKGDYGLNLGKMLHGTYEVRMVGNYTMPRVVAYTCAACDLRMAGAKQPVMTNSGSGNQGIAATLPVVVFAEDTQASESKLVRALTLSHLTVIYIKQMLGRLSAHCGCVFAATGSACGITYLMGGGYDQITYAVKNMIACLTGMVCDGAKPSCSLKLSAAVSQAFQSAMMALENRCVSHLDGIIDISVDQTIRNLSEIGREGMQPVDRMILDIMTSKEKI